jgi:hypothetical protein
MHLAADVIAGCYLLFPRHDVNIIEYGQTMPHVDIPIDYSFSFFVFPFHHARLPGLASSA